MSLRVAELAGLRQFQLRELSAPPPPGAHEVQVEVSHVGICGSDLHYYAEGGVGPARCRYPMVIGHEPAGRITALGSGVAGWSAGDPVLLEPAPYGYHCEFCLSGRHNVCSQIRFMSTPVEPGFFRDRLNLPASNLLRPPAGVGLAEGPLFEPLAIVLHSMTFARPAVGDTAFVAGAGPIGLLTIAVLCKAGVSRIWCAEPIAHRREMALALGASAVLDPAEEPPERRILAETRGRGVDLSVDCAAWGETLNQCIRATRSAGRVVLTGIPGTLDYALDIHTLRVRQHYFYTTRRSNHTSEAAVRLLEEDSRLLGPIVTHQRPVEDINRTFETAARYEDGVGKAVVTFL
jgi:L-iditol 2-dehydrogenase